MATEINVTKNVYGGASEYSTELTPSASGDKINMLFDNEVVLDDIIVTLESGASLSYKLNVVYPTGTTMEITPSAQSASYALNQNSDSRNLWYRLPKWATLQLEFTALTTAKKVKLSAIGRG